MARGDEWGPIDSYWNSELGFVLGPQSSDAQSSIAGAWKIDPDRTSFPTAPEVLLLKKSTYQCKICLPPLALRADAADHPVKASP
jgi:hypothetical protein